MLHRKTGAAAKLVLSFLITTCLSHPVTDIAQIKRDVSELNDSYDYIVVGGGTSGLTVADRLSADGTKTVLVVEYGYLELGEDILIPAPASLDRNLAYFYNYSSVPQIEMFNQTTTVYAAAIVGGGSAVDHMMFDRGSADDYDNWEKLGNPGWGWTDLFPYFQKSVNFTPPTLEQQADFGYTYDTSAYGGHGPIQASYPPFQWPQQKLQWNGWRDLGITAQKEGAGGDAVGLFWIPSSLDLKTETRSFSTLGYYEPAVPRKNYHLLTGYQVREVVISNLCATGVTLKARGGTNSKITTVNAKQEVVLAAGAFGSPVLLQRSGLGPKALLKSAGIKVQLDLPGVGNNLQDHAASLLLYIYATNPVPNTQTAASNATFAAEIQAEYTQNKTGPLTVGYGNSVVFLPLPEIDPNYAGLITQLTAQNSSQYLPSGYEATLQKGYLAQKKLLLTSYASNSSAILEVFFNGDPTTTTVLQKPLSRGVVTLNITSPYSDPIIDPRVFTNPIDLDLMVAILRFVRKWFQTPSQAPLTPVEIIPGYNVTSDTDLITAIRTYSTPTIGHAHGTCAMMPLELGGVVGADLTVWGVKGLSVVDASIMPLAPATHLDATVYAIAEKASDLIKSRAK
ncbi:GMC oxidoreductase [Stipitochalara longipes BDJ]|nr:GMC oxidoreductase [Stipitochalara longipes BDJ]